MKAFMSYNLQLKSLKERGLNIKDKSKVKKILIEENYFNIINGYKKLFLDPTSTTQTFRKFKAGTDFFEIYELYNFDRELRNIFFKKILIVENRIKSAIGYIFSKKYGIEYLDIDNFDCLNTSKNYDDHKLEKIYGVQIFLLQAYSNKLKSKTFINHYIKKHKQIPLWVLVKVLTLGSISKFYDVLRQVDQYEISKYFNTKDLPRIQKNMKGFIKLITIYRNICAHEERFYNEKVKEGIIENVYHRKLNIPFNPGTRQSQYGTQDILALLISLKALLPKDNFLSLKCKLENAINKLDKNLVTVSINDVLKEMGFPKNWKDL